MLELINREQERLGVKRMFPEKNGLLDKEMDY